MNEKGRAPQKRKQPLKQRVAIALLRIVEKDAPEKQGMQHRNASAAQRTAGGNRQPAPQRPAQRRNVQQRPGQQRNMPQRPGQQRTMQQRPAQQRNTPQRSGQQRNTPQRPGQPHRPMTAEQRRRHALYLQRMRRRKRMIRIGAAAAALLIVLLILSRTVFFKIEKIELTNPDEANYTPAQIEMASGITYGTQNLFSCDLKKVAKNIEQRLPYVGEAKVERDFPSTLRVTVTSAYAAAAISTGTSYLLIDADGKMLEIVETAPDDLPVLRCKTEFEMLLGQYIGEAQSGKQADEQTKAAKEMIELYKQILAAAKDAKIDDITLIDIRDVRAITLMYQGRLTLHVGTQDNLEQKLKSAAMTIAKEDDASSTRSGAINLTSFPYVYSRDTYETNDGAPDDSSDAEDVTEAQ